MSISPEIGINFHGMWSAYAADDKDRRTVLAAFQAAGIKTVRLDVSWAMVQPTATSGVGVWDMAYGVPFVDRVIRLCNSYGIKPLVMFWLTPGWANGSAGDRHLPTTVAKYSTALAWMANRYRGMVSGWEIWNEPNSTDFMYSTSPSNAATIYTALLVDAYNAVKAVAPAVLEPVVFGGIQYVDTPWVTSCYAAGAGNHFDVMGVHPYMAPSNLDPAAVDPPDIWHMTHVTTLHDLMVTNGDGHKPMWFTEFGWSSHVNLGGEASYALGVSETVQGTFATKTVHLCQTGWPYVAKVFWYKDHDDIGGAAQEDNYGALDVGLAPKRVLRNFKALNGL
jgi:hypothetical protein